MAKLLLVYGIVAMEEESDEEIAIIDYVLNTKNRIYNYLDTE